MLTTLTPTLADHMHDWDHGWWPVIRRMEERGYVRVETAGPRIEHAVKTRRVIRIARELPTLLAREEAFGRAKRQREAYETLESLGGRAEAAHLTAALYLRNLIKVGRASLCLPPAEPNASSRCFFSEGI